MIISGLIYIATVVLQLILSIFPTSQGLPTEVTSPIPQLSGYVGILDPLVPISTLAQALSILLLFVLTLFTFNAVIWLYGNIPFFRN